MTPSRTTIYKGPVYGSTRWDGFVPRDDDVFICTPPKSGTTWTQAICAFLIFGRTGADIKPGMISPWIDSKSEPIDELYAMLAAQTHRRFIKTHTPLDGVPYFPQCTYLSVYRDPRDTYFSMRGHAANLKSEKLAHRLVASVGDGFREWATKSFTPGDPESFALGANVHHYQSYRRHAALRNLHFFHYADMKRDLRGAIMGMAAALNLTPSDVLLAEIVDAVSFENMRENARNFAPNAGSGVWKDDRQFFSNGQSQRWRETLSSGDLALYDVRVRALLPEDEIAWLHNGSAAPALFTGL